ncbi:hypothetical protein MMC30_004852 [Trapelia coarctata]|nr:hypothetical protein [Trapelia coarctata]
MRFPPSSPKKKPLRFHHLTYALMVVFILYTLYRARSDSLVHRMQSPRTDHNISGLVAEYRKKMEEWMKQNPTQQQKDLKNDQMKAALRNSLTRIWE